MIFHSAISNIKKIILISIVIINLIKLFKRTYGIFQRGNFDFKCNRPAPTGRLGTGPRTYSRPPASLAKVPPAGLLNAAGSQLNRSASFAEFYRASGRPKRGTFSVQNITTRLQKVTTAPINRYVTTPSYVGGPHPDIWLSLAGAAEERN